MLDSASFDTLFRSQYRHLLIYALQFVEAEEDAIDIVGDAFGDVWERRDSIKEDTVKSYLYTLVRNRCIDLLRRRNSEKNYIDYIINNVSEVSDESTVIAEQERNEILNQKLSQLSPQMRQMVEHKILDSMKYQEIADKMGLTINVVKKQMSKAINILKMHK